MLDPAVTLSAQYLELILTKGKTTRISLEDAERVLAHKWCVTVTRKGFWYAKRKVVRPDGKATSEMLHRFVLSAPKGLDVDHINGDTLDNRRENLRTATRSQNAINRHAKLPGKTSRFRGVSWDRHKGRWRAFVSRLHIGYFASEDAAAKAYDEAVRRLYGRFASPNNP